MEVLAHNKYKINFDLNYVKRTDRVLNHPCLHIRREKTLRKRIKNDGFHQSRTNTHCSAERMPQHITHQMRPEEISNRCVGPILIK